MNTIILTLIGSFILFAIILIQIKRRYINCPAGKILIIEGLGINTNENGCEVLAGGSKFVYPIIQHYRFIDLGSYILEFNEKLYTKDNLSLKAKMKISYAVSNMPSLAKNAAMLLSGLKKEEIANISNETIHSQLLKLFKNKDIVDIVANRRNEKLIPEIQAYLNKDLNKLGIEIINITLYSINDFKDQILFLEKQYQELKTNRDHSIKDKNNIDLELKKVNEAIDKNILEQNELLDYKLKLLANQKAQIS